MDTSTETTATRDATRHIVVELPAAPSAPRLARRAVEQLDLAPEQLGTVALLASELVTNAFRHAEATGPIRLEATIRERRLRLLVTDFGGGFPPPEHPRPGGERGGYGLYLVEQLAGSWGVSDSTVWFELPAAAAAG